jgi:hypothetical protein
MSNHTPNPIQIPLPIEGETFQIKLTKGYVAIVDAVDADLLEFKWYASEHGNHVYAIRGIQVNGKATSTQMHREILSRKVGLKLFSSQFCDHVNSNGLDNRRCNLRVATKMQNNQNMRKSSHNTSGYKGVSYNKERNCWEAYIHMNNKKRWLGRFNTAEEAYEAYCKEAVKEYGEFARFK